MASSDAATTAASVASHTAEERATALLATLSSADEPTSARASAVKLRALVGSPDAADYVLRSYTELFGSIEVLLDDRSGVRARRRRRSASSARVQARAPRVRRLAPPRGAHALRPARAPAERPAAAGRGRCCSRRCTVRAAAAPERAAAAVLPFLPELLGCVQSCSGSSTSRAPRGAAAAARDARATRDGGGGAPAFAELVDLLLGWALDPRSSARTHLRGVGGQLGPLWAASALFAVGLMQSVDDVERLHLPTARTRRTAPPRDGPQLGCVRVFCAAASGLGRYAQLAEQPAPTARLPACLNAAVREPEADGGGGDDEDEEDGGLLPPLLSAAGRTFAAVATDCVATLSRVLRGGFAPHHAAAVRLIHVQLADGASSSAVLRALSLHLAVLRAQQGALPPTAAHDLTRADSPLLRLRRHPSPAVVGALLATHRQLILGAHATNQAVSSILLQAILSRLEGDRGADARRRRRRTRRRRRAHRRRRHRRHRRRRRRRRCRVRRRRGGGRRRALRRRRRGRGGAARGVT